MEARLAGTVQRAIEWLATALSNPNRRANAELKETWKLSEKYPLSETTMAVIYRRDKTQQKLLVWFFFVEGRKPGWRWLIPTADQLYGMIKLAGAMQEVEEENSPLKAAAWLEKYADEGDWSKFERKYSQRVDVPHGQATLRDLGRTPVGK